MKTNRLILVLAGLALGIGIAACGGDEKKKDGPSFEDPADSPTRIDRKGRPALNTIIKKVLDTSGASSDAFNAASPSADEAAFGSALPTVVGLLHACPPASLTSALLPDVLTITTTTTSGFLNGRTLEDDVFDLLLLSVYSSNGGATFCSGTSAAILTDHIDENDVDFLTEFPYLAAPH